jgi:hypothetical protein
LTNTADQAHDLTQLSGADNTFSSHAHQSENISNYQYEKKKGRAWYVLSGIQSSKAAA